VKGRIDGCLVMQMQPVPSIGLGLAVTLLLEREE